MKVTILFASVVFAGASIVSAWAQSSDEGQTKRQPDTTKSAASTSGTSTLNKMDSQFVTKAAQGGLAEVQLGQLAKDKGSSQAVKDFGDRMVTDHSQANNDLKSIASSKGITVPDAMDTKDKATYDRLSKLSGAQFDRAYMNTMVKDHQTDVTEFRKESQSAKDPDIKSFASKTLPTLESHLEMARTTDRQLGATSKK